MDLHIAENCQLLRREVTTHWKTGVLMTGVAIVVGRVYGKMAALGIVLITASHYQIIGQQIRVISWMSLRKALIAVVIFGNSYYKVIDPQILSYIAVALILIDNFQLSSINVELSTQNETLEKNNAKLKEAQESLTKLEEELNQLVKPAGKLQAAQRTNTEKAETLNGTISEIIQNIPSRLQNVNVMLRKLLSMPEMTELVSFEADLRSKVDAMVLAFDGFFTELGPVAQKVEGLSAKLETRVATLEATIVLERKHVVALNVVLQKVQSYSQRRQR
ncbi:MAG TPA: hypothetical protein VMR37_02170 [Rhabdochlamydiaceae bacterium]|nr:hypothetical protein [Rhabdochlamydiaceae bacterium]